MALQQEPLEDAIARADSTIRFEADDGEENGPYDPDAFSIIRGNQLLRGDRMAVDGRTLAVHFPAPIEPGDEVLA